MITDEKIDKLLSALDDKNWGFFKGIYILLDQSEYLGYWCVLANEIEEEKEKKDRDVFFKKHNMINKGVLELPPYEISANKYNL